MILDEDGLKFIIKRIRKVFVATFRREKEAELNENIRSSLVKDQIGIYIHIPFCKSLCPACPYVRDIFHENLVRDYLSALKTEIKIVRQILKGFNVRVVDIHAGGGRQVC